MITLDSSAAVTDFAHKLRDRVRQLWRQDKVTKEQLGLLDRDAERLIRELGRLEPSGVHDDEDADEATAAGGAVVARLTGACPTAIPGVANAAVTNKLLTTPGRSKYSGSTTDDLGMVHVVDGIVLPK